MAAYSCRLSLDLQLDESWPGTPSDNLAAIERVPERRPVRGNYSSSLAASAVVPEGPAVNCHPNRPLMHRLPEVTS